MKSEESDDELLHSNIPFFGDRLMIRKQEREVPTKNLGG
jgi:hypothetical protein